jgi:hypothetical protein
MVQIHADSLRKKPSAAEGRRGPHNVQPFFTGKGESTMKSREELLSEEVRAYADMASKMLQWGVTLMISVQTALFFVRQQILNGYIDAQQLPRGSGLPMGRYVIGTVFLMYLAFVLSWLTARTNSQYRHYKRQLIECRSSKIADLPIKRTGRLAYALYFSFPVIDLAVKVVLVKISFG